jgi:hypothetical protein
MLQREIFPILFPCENDGHRRISVEGNLSCISGLSSFIDRRFGSQRNLSRNTSSKDPAFFFSAILTTLEDYVPALLALLLFDTREEVQQHGAKKAAFPNDIGNGGFLPRDTFCGGFRVGEQVPSIACTLCQSRVQHSGLNEQQRENLPEERYPLRSCRSCSSAPPN